MFKFIGAAVVYGFALFGIYKALEGDLDTKRASLDGRDTN